MKQITTLDPECSLSWTRKVITRDSAAPSQHNRPDTQIFLLLSVVESKQSASPHYADPRLRISAGKKRRSPGIAVPLICSMSIRTAVSVIRRTGCRNVVSA